MILKIMIMIDSITRTLRHLPKSSRTGGKKQMPCSQHKLLLLPLRRTQPLQRSPELMLLESSCGE